MASAAIRQWATSFTNWCWRSRKRKSALTESPTGSPTKARSSRRRLTPPLASDALAVTILGAGAPPNLTPPAPGRPAAREEPHGHADRGTRPSGEPRLRHGRAADDPARPAVALIRQTD